MLLIWDDLSRCIGMLLRWEDLSQVYRYVVEMGGSL